MTLSATQSLVLGAVARHHRRLAAARNAVFRSLLQRGLLAECGAPLACQRRTRKNNRLDLVG